MKKKKSQYENSSATLEAISIDNDKRLTKEKKKALEVQNRLTN